MLVISQLIETTLAAHYDGMTRSMVNSIGRGIASSDRLAMSIFGVLVFYSWLGRYASAYI